MFIQSYSAICQFKNKFWFCVLAKSLLPQRIFYTCKYFFRLHLSCISIKCTYIIKYILHFVWLSVLYVDDFISVLSNSLNVHVLKHIVLIVRSGLSALVGETMTV